MEQNELLQKIEKLEKEMASLKASRGVRAFFRRAVSKSSFIAGVALAASLTGFLAWATQNTFVDGTVISAADVNANFTELYNKTETIESRMGKYCYAKSSIGHDLYSATWTDLAGLSECELTTTGRPLKVTMNFSVFGKSNGGIRLMMDNSTVFGDNSTYGFDWVICVDNTYEKKNIVRVIDGVAAGTHSFKVQIKSQTDGQRLYVQPGTGNYAGFHLLIEEL